MRNFEGREERNNNEGETSMKRLNDTNRYKNSTPTA